MEKLFGDSTIRKNPKSIKYKAMSERQKVEASDAFDSMRDHFKPVHNNSMNNEQILNHPKRARL